MTDFIEPYLDPDLLSFGEQNPCTGAAQVIYAGMPIPNLYRLPIDGAGAHTQRYYATREVERRVEMMSNHEKLEFWGRVRRFTSDQRGTIS